MEEIPAGGENRAVFRKNLKFSRVSLLFSLIRRSLEEKMDFLFLALICSLALEE